MRINYGFNYSVKHTNYIQLLLLFLLPCISLPFYGCNLFSGIDKPSGDHQLLSAARACFDEGDFICASKYYNQVSKSYADEVHAELAFQILAQNGMGVETFADAVIAFPGDPGRLITKLAGALVDTASQTVRLNLIHALQKAELINSDPERGLVVFIAGISIFAELLAESATLVPNELVQEDLVTSVSQCTANQLSTFVGCQGPVISPATTPIIIRGTGAIDLTTATDAQLTGPPTLYMINSAVQKVNDGISLLAAEGNLGTSTAKFTENILLLSSAALMAGTVSDSAPYRALLFASGLGLN